MNKLNIFLICAALLAVLLTACSENSSSSEPEYVFDASVVCPAEGQNAYGEPNRGTFIDERDGRTYKYTTIGNQVWMAENLKIEADQSQCLKEIENYCDSVGRFYISAPLRQEHDVRKWLATICPSGWHVPSVLEWDSLFTNMGSDAKGLLRLQSTTVFENVIPGTDDCAFNILPMAVGLEKPEDPKKNYKYISPYFATSTFFDLISLYSFYINTKVYYVRSTIDYSFIRCIKNN